MRRRMQASVFQRARGHKTSRPQRGGAVVQGQPQFGDANHRRGGRGPTAAQRVRRDGLDVHLTPTEFKLLEFLMRNRGRWVTKTQVFNAVYGLFDAEVDEAVVESHVSKLRKKLRERLGYDPIESKRYLGYTIS